MISLFLTSAKSNDITNIFVKSILVQKLAFSFIYDIIMSPKHFEIKKQRFASLITVKIDSYQLCVKISTVVVFGSERYLTTVAFGSESVKRSVFTRHPHKNIKYMYISSTYKLKVHFRKKAMLVKNICILVYLWAI